MILYTVVDLDHVLAGLGQDAPCFEVPDGSRRLICRPDGRGGATIVQMISSDAQDYLNPAYAPGAAYFPSRQDTSPPSP